MRRRNYVVVGTRASYFVDLSPSIFNKRRFFSIQFFGITLLLRTHLYIEAESNSEVFQFWTRHYCRKLGIFTEVEFFSEPRPRLISSSKSKFRDKDQSIWLDRTPKNPNPKLLLNQHCRNSAPDSYLTS